MQLVIRNGRVLAMHEPDQQITHAYPDCEIIQWEGSEDALNKIYEEETEVWPLDPRTNFQKLIDARDKYLRERKLAYPSIDECLMMIFRDMRDGTTEFVNAIQVVDEQYPKPEGV